MKGMGVRKAMGYNMTSITNSPVNGLLYVRGKISATPSLAVGPQSEYLRQSATLLTYPMEAKGVALRDHVCCMTQLLTLLHARVRRQRSGPAGRGFGAAFRRRHWADAAGSCGGAGIHRRLAAAGFQHRAGTCGAAYIRPRQGFRHSAPGRGADT